MRKICSWCGKVIAVGKPDAIITHSICKVCMEKVQQQIEEWERKKTPPPS